MSDAVPKLMTAIELEQAREVARKPWRYESAHPTKFADMISRLLDHIDAIESAKAPADAE